MIGEFPLRCLLQVIDVSHKDSVICCPNPLLCLCKIVTTSSRSSDCNSHHKHAQYSILNAATITTSANTIGNCSIERVGGLHAKKKCTGRPSLCCEWNPYFQFDTVECLALCVGLVSGYVRFDAGLGLADGFCWVSLNINVIIQCKYTIQQQQKGE